MADPYQMAVCPDCGGKGRRFEDPAINGGIGVACKCGTGRVPVPMGDAVDTARLLESKADAILAESKEPDMEAVALVTILRIGARELRRRT